MGARETALNALITCRRYEGWSNAVLKDCIRRDKLDARDAALQPGCATVWCRTGASWTFTWPSF